MTRERILAMRAIWTEDAPEFHGEFVDFGPLLSYPKPVQVGGPPILMGATSPWSWDRLIEYCDGWIPIGPDLEAGLQAIEAATRAAGRPLAELDHTVMFMPGQHGDGAREAADAGCRVVLGLPTLPEDEMLPALDEAAEFARGLR